MSQTISTNRFRYWSFFRRQNAPALIFAGAVLVLTNKAVLKTLLKTIMALISNGCSCYCSMLQQVAKAALSNRWVRRELLKHSISVAEKCGYCNTNKKTIMQAIIPRMI